jgi:hypothetical protein
METQSSKNFRVASDRVSIKTSMKRGWKQVFVPNLGNMYRVECFNQNLNEKRMETGIFAILDGGYGRWVRLGFQSKPQ